MKKIFALALVLVLALGSFAACGGEQEAENGVRFGHV